MAQRLHRRRLMDPATVLIVDDEPDIVQLLRTYLTAQGYHTEAALNGGDALMLAELSRPDAIILDLNLPDMSGADILERLRAADASIPVIMLTGNNNEAVARGLLRAGALDYIRKPFDFETLDTALSAAVAVGRKRPRCGVVLPFTAKRRTGAGRASA